MLEKPIEWRRFERVELEGQVARTAPRNPVLPSVPATPSLLQEFERVLRENERLRLEVSTLRAEKGRNGSGTEKFREELKSAKAELARIEEPVVEPSQPHVADSLDTVSQADAQSERETSQADLAAVVAEYIFSKPTKGNIKLVADALRARGVRP